MSKDFFKSFIDDLGEVDTTVASEGTSSAEFSGYIDSGSYTFNAVVSGSIFKGIPNNKALVIAGDPATGKTFFALGIIKHHLATNLKARVFYFDTESAVTNEMMTQRGIDLSRVAKSEPATIERFRTVALKVLDTYATLAPEDRFPLLMVLDSLSALPSNKEVTDIGEGKDTKDMTKPGLIKGAFRVLRLKMGKLQVPFIVTSHVYAVIGAYVPTKEVAGGSGAKYAADTLLFLSKSKDKDDEKTQRGIVVHVRAMKSRLARESAVVETRILYDGGLDRYYGLLDHAVAAGIVKKVSNKVEFPDGTKVYEKKVLAHPERFFTQEILEKLDTYIQSIFTYTDPTGSGPVDSDEGEDE